MIMGAPACGCTPDLCELFSCLWKRLEAIPLFCVEGKIGGKVYKGMNYIPLSKFECQSPKSYHLRMCKDALTMVSSINSD